MSEFNAALKGRKLLILGATAGELTLVKRAQELGVYVIVTDYNSDWSYSPAKYVADEAWNISWSDVDTLEQKCRECGIAGVTAGYSEFRVESLIKLCTRLNLPCYSTLEQLEITRDKIKFKNYCRECGVPVVKEFASQETVDEYPVIVKPVDRAGSIGISVAKNKSELQQACEYANGKSVSKQIIIEKFIDTGTKIDFYYAVENGEISLISSCDTINAKDNGYERVVQSAWLYPSRNEEYIIRKVDPALRSMIQRMGIKYGCIFFSGFIDKEGTIVFFECGFRLEGGHQYNYVSQKGPYNFLDLFIYHALTGDTKRIKRRECNAKLYAATINLYAKKGILTEVGGVEEIAQMKNCCLALMYGRIGESCKDDQAILSKIGMFQFVSESSSQLQNDVERMYQIFSVFNENGDDIVYDRVDASVIANWWSANELQIKLKDDSVSFEDIQKLLNLAHEVNKSYGLIYATANQSVEKLTQKIGNGKCFVAFQKDSNGIIELAGTATIEERTLNYWYVGDNKKKVLLLKLVGVHPKYKGNGIGRKLLAACLHYAIENEYEMMVTDSAEQNLALRKMVLSEGFRVVDCCKYAANNFISTVYAKWIAAECPWTETYCMEKYQQRRNDIIRLCEERE